MSKDGMTSERWAHIKQLQPAPARWVHKAIYPIYMNKDGQLTDNVSDAIKYVGNTHGTTYRKPKEEANVEA